MKYGQSSLPSSSLQCATLRKACDGSALHYSEPPSTVGLISPSLVSVDGASGRGAEGEAVDRKVGGAGRVCGCLNVTDTSLTDRHVKASFVKEST